MRLLCAVWRSVDGGGTWTKTVNGLPPAGDNLGRIGIGMAPSRPSRVYANVTNGLVGNYRAQFNKIIRGSSYHELVSRLEAKTRTDAQASVSATDAPSKTTTP